LWIGLTLAVGLVGFGLGIGVGRWTGRESVSPEETEVPDDSRLSERPAKSLEFAEILSTEPAVPEPAVVEPLPTQEVEPGGYPSGEGVRIALVIDDFGRSLREVERVIALGVPVSCAVLPFETRTDEVANALLAGGAEILCHLPMQPRNDADPGPGALTPEMAPDDLDRATRAALARVPEAIGANNHMGSAVSGESRSMRTILGVVKEHNLYYLDSRTSPDTVAYRMAIDLGIPAAERQVFLDADSTAEGVRFQFDRLLDLGRRRGSAIAIGHPSKMTLDILAERIPLALESGYEFVPVSYLLDRVDVLPQ